MKKQAVGGHRTVALVVWMCTLVALVAGPVPGPTPAAAQVKIPSPDLIGKLTKQLSITPEQAVGGAGSLFNLAKGKLTPDDFSKVAAAVPGMDGLLKAAPSSGAASGLGALIPGGAGGLASVAGSFQKLGLSPDMVGKFVPVLTQHVQSTGGADVASLLAGALK